MNKPREDALVSMLREWVKDIGPETHGGRCDYCYAAKSEHYFECLVRRTEELLEGKP